MNAAYVEAVHRLATIPKVALNVPVTMAMNSIHSITHVWHKV